MSDQQHLEIGKDPDTQEMVHKAADVAQREPDVGFNEALQKEADAGPGREAKVGEGQSTTGRMMQSVKTAATSVAETVKEANPATRDTREKHC